MAFEDRLAARRAAHLSWAGTVSRSARTHTARSNSPAGVEWHLRRLGSEFDEATDAERFAAAESARRAYMAELQIRAAASRRAKRGAA